MSSKYKRRKFICNNLYNNRMPHDMFTLCSLNFKLYFWLSPIMSLFIPIKFCYICTLKPLQRDPFLFTHRESVYSNKFRYLWWKPLRHLLKKYISWKTHHTENYKYCGKAELLRLFVYSKEGRNKNLNKIRDRKK